jgi:nucleoside-diphosphate-sugar epimerase
MSRGSHHTKLSGSLGAMERTAVIDAVKEALSYAGHTAENELHPEMPTGPPNLVPDNSLERRLLGWEPAVSFRDGLHRTIDWYYANRDRAAVSDRLDLTLTER